MSSEKYQNFFTDLANTTPYLKMAAEGGAGTGKTWTLALIIVGLYKRIGAQKPIVIFDSEDASKFLRQLFKDNGISAVVKNSQTLSDLSKTMLYCEEGGGEILFVDSITPVYEAFIDAYAQKQGRSVQFNDYRILKPIWKREFRRPFVDAKYHIFFTGREGYEWEFQTNEETGKKELVKTGVKMKAEGDTAYEPDVLIRMERFERLLDGDKKEIWREATVVKGRGGLIDGAVIKNPTYTDFEPFVEFLLRDISEYKPTISHDDEHLFQEGRVNYEEQQQAKIMLERNNALLDKVAAGTTKEAKSMRLALMDYAYQGETSELAIAKMSLDTLADANDRLATIVKLIGQVLRGEAKCYPVAKAVTAARIKYLDTENLGEAEPPKLEAYVKHMAEKVIEEQKKEAEKAKKGEAA